MNLEELELKLKTITNKNNFLNEKNKKYEDKSYLLFGKIIYSFFIDIIASLIVSYTLYQIYCHFFNKSKYIFALLLFLSIISALYYSIKNMMKN